MYEVLQSPLACLAYTRPLLVPSSGIIDLAVHFACMLPHAIYVCLYLATAEAEDAVLLTADEEFVSRCRKRLKHEPATARLRLLEELEA